MTGVRVPALLAALLARESRVATMTMGIGAILHRAYAALPSMRSLAERAERGAPSEG